MLVSLQIKSTKGLHSSGYLKAIIYGPSGNGKTTLLGSTGESTLIVSAESGLLSLRESKLKEIYGDWVVSPDCWDISVDENGNQIPEDERIFQLSKVYKYLLTEAARKKYSWVFVDSLTEVSELLVAALKSKYPNKKDSMNLWGEYDDEMRKIIKKFRDLPGFNVGLIALDKDVKEEDGQLKTVPDLAGKKQPHRISGYYDLVLYYHKAKGEDGQFVRKLLTEGTDTIRAKDRSGALARLEEPNLRDITNKIKGGK